MMPHEEFTPMLPSVLQNTFLIHAVALRVFRGFWVFFAACHDAASSHPPHPLPPVPDAFGQADRLHVQGTMPAAGERKCNPGIS